MDHTLFTAAAVKALAEHFLARGTTLLDSDLRALEVTLNNAFKPLAVQIKNQIAADAEAAKEAIAKAAEAPPPPPVSTPTPAPEGGSNA